MAANKGLPFLGAMPPNVCDGIGDSLTERASCRTRDQRASGHAGAFFAPLRYATNLPHCPRLHGCRRPGGPSTPGWRPPGCLLTEFRFRFQSRSPAPVPQPARSCPSGRQAVKALLVILAEVSGLWRD